VSGTRSGPPPAWPEVRRRGLSSEQVAADQRGRVYAGLAPALAEVGYERLTVERLIAAAGISRRTFYELFEGKAEAFLAAHRDALDRLDRAVGEACAGEERWPVGVRAGVEACLEFAAGDPAMARLAAGDPFTAGPFAGRCQDALLRRLGSALREGRACAEAEPPEVTEAGLISGVAGVVLMRLRAAGDASVRELAPQLTEVLLTPYVGREEAARIAAGDDR